MTSTRAQSYIRVRLSQGDVESEAQKRDFQRWSRLAIQFVGAADSGEFDHITPAVVMAQAYEPKQFDVRRSGPSLVAVYRLACGAATRDAAIASAASTSADAGSVQRWSI